ncbi:hypothetical protein BCR34DRAFT_599192 [Clohesyomyces aquaticus]|uniref:BRCT domain-containing protein n=1 Tax=Clohesyomyces aquaticus TaxID=1231657 RepID=A0A1Y1ZVZ1_9PLEO|nr:hypothetical protein BCR34DRAFT_599192 [Clohesyomyces aquaticus]
MSVLKKLVISSTGDHGPKVEPNLKKWVENNGGKWVARATKGMTHLICTKAAWKKQPEAVTAALKYCAQIVSYDWLEDSLMSKRKLAERKYTLQNLTQARRKKKEMVRMGKKVDAAKFDQGCEEARADTGSGKSKCSTGFFRSALQELEEKRRVREEAKAQAAAEVLKSSPTPTTSSLHIQEPDQAQTTIDEQGRAYSHAGDLPTPSPSSRATCISSKRSPSVPSVSRRPKPSPIYKPVPRNALLFPPKAPPVPPSSPSQDAQANPAPSKFKDLYHLYMDTTGFSYNILLIRMDLLRNSSERYNIRLYESHTVPRVYCAVVRYSPAGVKGWPSTEMKSLSSGMSLGPDKKMDTKAEQNLNFQHIHVLPQDATTVSNTNATPNTDTTASPNISASAETQARLAALASSAASTPSTRPTIAPFTTLLTPLSSTFAAAFLSFRHAFRDLTLLTWDQRLLPHSRILQKALAKSLHLEPFLYSKPSAGLPVGLAHQFPDADPQGFEEREEGYVRGKLGLPGMDVGLDRSGTFGMAIAREEEDEVRKREDEMREIIRKEEEGKRGGGKGREGRR